MYDYIMLLDTEGVRSEAVGNKIHDNRLTAFAVWPADATFVMINGEDPQALHDILPVVSDAYQSSPLAERDELRPFSLLFFVQRGLTKQGTDTVGAAKGLKNNIYATLQKSIESVTEGGTASTSIVKNMLFGFDIEKHYVQLGMHLESLRVNIYLLLSFYIDINQY
jgi:hypothetical protein